MRPCVTLLLAAGLLLPVLSLHADKPPTPQERADALPALRAARKHPDLEVRRYAAELSELIGRRVETAHVLGAPRLRVQYKNVPVSQVLADLSKRSGNPIRLGVSAEVVENRK